MPRTLAKDTDDINRTSLIERLLASLGIGTEGFQDAVAWSLCEHLVAFLSSDQERLVTIKNKPDSLTLLAEYLRDKTGRKWAIEEVKALRQRVYMTFEPQTREPIKYDDWLRLLFTTPLKCAKCGAEPPHVKLEIDHVVPVAKGGRSGFENLRFLCERDNRKKSAKLEVGKPWLKLR